VLSIVAGSVHVIGFLALGGLFTAHITGNIVILAARFSRRPASRNSFTELSRSTRKPADRSGAGDRGCRLASPPRSCMQRKSLIEPRGNGSIGGRQPAPGNRNYTARGTGTSLLTANCTAGASGMR
jgi:hypothetical protein